MNKILLLILFTSTVFNAQNKDLIKETFYKQPINNLDNAALENGLKGNETVCIKAYFRTNSIGDIIDTKIDGNSKIFESEINSIISQIPKLDPNEYLVKGEIMKYGIKLCFKLATNKERKKILKEGIRIGIRVKWFYVKEYFPVKTIEITETGKNDFSQMESLPVTQACKNITGKSEIKKCVMNDIVSHINRKFDTGLAAELGLSEGKQRVVITFYISKNGEIVNIKATGSREELIEEGIRVINTFPDFYEGGKIDGVPVNVKYSIPITFFVS